MGVGPGAGLGGRGGAFGEDQEQREADIGEADDDSAADDAENDTERAVQAGGGGIADQAADPGAEDAEHNQHGDKDDGGGDRDHEILGGDHARDIGLHVFIAAKGGQGGADPGADA